jgi:hypothetical protein
VRVPGPSLADAPPRLAPRVPSRPAPAAVLAISTSARQRALRDDCTEPMGRRPVHACFPPPIARREERVRCLAPLTSATLSCARRRASQSLARCKCTAALQGCARTRSRLVSPRQQRGRLCPGPSSQADRTSQLGQLQSRLPAARVDGSAAAALQLALPPARCGLASESQYRRHQLRCALYRPHRCRHCTALHCTALHCAQLNRGALVMDSPASSLSRISPGHGDTTTLVARLCNLARVPSVAAPNNRTTTAVCHVIGPQPCSYTTETAHASSWANCDARSHVFLMPTAPVCQCHVVSAPAALPLSLRLHFVSLYLIFTVVR